MNRLATFMLMFFVSSAASAGTGTEPVLTTSVGPPGLQQGIFYIGSTGTGAPLALRGVNYIRTTPWSVFPPMYPDLFQPTAYADDVASGRIDAALSQIKASGYNYVRVFIDSRYSVSGFGMSAPGVPNLGGALNDYTDWVGDFLNRAYNNGLWVMLGAGQIPQNYLNPAPAPVANVDGDNVYLLHPAYVAAKGQFLHDLLSKLHADWRYSIGFQSLFAVDIRNEMYVSSCNQPWSQTTGSVTFGGVSYDMSNASWRQQLVDAQSVEWLNSVCGQVKSAASSVLCTTSTITPYEAQIGSFNGVQCNTSFPNYPLRTAVLDLYSNADYVDVHAYPSGSSYDLGASLGSAEIGPWAVQTKPLLMGETGAFRSIYTTSSAAGNALRAHLSTSCASGYTGWSVWTWDSDEQTPGPTSSTPSFWNLVDSSGALNAYLAPASWPTASLCQPIPTGIFRTASAVYYSNGTRYCWYDTWGHFMSLTGLTNLDGVPVYPRTQALMPYDGICH